MYLIKTVALIYLLSTPVSALAAASGSSPKGKPFVEINGQIVEVQGQLATLEQRLDNVVARVALYDSRLDGLAAGIALLELENSKFSQKISELESGLISVDEMLLALESKNNDLQIELETYGDLTGELTLDVESNKMLINTLKAYVDDGKSALEILIQQNSQAIYELGKVQQALEGQLESKQKIINRKCDQGYVVSGIADGDLVCHKQPDTDSPVKVIQVEITRELQAGNFFSSGERRYFTPRPDLGTGKWASSAIVAGTERDWKYANILVMPCPEGTYIIGGGVKTYPEYFLRIQSEKYGDFGYEIRVEAINTYVSGGYASPAYLNPLWEKYMPTLNRSYFIAPAEESLFVTGYALCLGAVSTDPT